MGIVADMVRSFYRSRNFEVVIRPVRNASRQMDSEIVLPNADYAPWKSDADFQAVYQAIKQNTLVDIYRCWELWEGIGNVCRCIPGDVLEVGVWQGGTGSVLARRLQKLAPERTIFLADTFEGVVKAGKNDSRYVGGEHSDTSESLVQNLLGQKLGLQNFKILKGIFPDQTGFGLENHTFSLVHIDVDVYQSCKEIVDWIWPRLSIGGILFFDDYGFTNCDGVVRYINEQKSQSDRLIFHNLNGHAIAIKLK